jgi:hypothetical protein
MTYPRQLKQTGLKAGGGFSDIFSPQVIFLANFETNFNDVVHGYVPTENGGIALETGAIPPNQAGFGNSLGGPGGLTTTQYLQYAGPDADFQLFGDVTIDFWWRPASFAVNRFPFQTSNLNASISANTSGIISAGTTRGTCVASVALTAGVWSHIAWVQPAAISGTARLFINGVQRATVIVNSQTYVLPTSFRIANDYNGTQTASGRLDAFRITAAQRWTSGFTPDTSSPVWP